MLMADAFAITMFFVGLAIVLPATLMLFGTLWPAATERAQTRITSQPVTTFLTGLGVTLIFVVLTAGLGGAGLPALALPVAAFGLCWSLFGASGLSRYVGGRLTRKGRPAWRGHLRGSIFLVLAFLTPVPGWVLIFPATLILGAGAATLSLFKPAAPRIESPAVPGVAAKVEEKKVEVTA